MKAWLHLLAQVTEVNGAKVNNLRDLVKSVESAPGPYIRFDLDYNQVGMTAEGAMRTDPEVACGDCQLLPKRRLLS